ncbi:hypothetical protein VPH35_129304 [Triticum aestivum]
MGWPGARDIRLPSSSQAGNAAVLASPLRAPLSCVVTTAMALLAIDLPKCFSPQMVPSCPYQIKRQVPPDLILFRICMELESDQRNLEMFFSFTDTCRYMEED